MLKRWLLICCIFTGCSTGFTVDFSQLPYSETELILHSEKQIDEQVKAFDIFIDDQLSIFVNASRDGLYEQAYQAWAALYSRFFSLKLLFGQTEMRLQQKELKSYLATQGKKIHQLLQEKIFRKEGLFESFLKNGLAAASLTAHQRALTESILLEYQEKYQNDSKISSSLEKLNLFERTNFSYSKVKSSLPSQKFSEDLRVFTANIICFPEDLAWFYGGISPWPTRIKALTKIIEETHAQIVCLQEVWDPAAMQSLIQCFKKEYSFFVCDAGDQFGTLDPYAIGLGCGVFIASKIPLDQVVFTPYPRSIPAKAAANRGALLASCAINGQKIAFIGTHLQHGDEAINQSVRKEQLHLCYAGLQTAIAKENSDSSWGFLMGDININAFSKEFYESGMATLFSIPYVKGQTAVTPANATATNYFTDLVNTPYKKRSEIAPTYELLDYCVSPMHSLLKIPNTQQKIVLFDIDQPEKALSDHQGILTIWHTKRLPAN